MLLKMNNVILKRCLNVVLIIAILFLIFMGGCYGLTKLIYVSKGCEHFYIDNTEMHTGIDIPKTLKIDCQYDKQMKRKRLYFVIDKSSVPMFRYISFSGFKVLEKDFIVTTDDFIHYNEDSLKKRKTNSTLFYKKYADANGESYKALLDSNSGKVWIDLKYAD